MSTLAITLGVLAMVTIAVIIGAVYAGGGMSAVRRQLPLLVALGSGVIATAVLFPLLLMNERTRWLTVAFVAFGSAATAAWEAISVRNRTHMPRAIPLTLWSAAGVLTVVGVGAVAATLGGR